MKKLLVALLAVQVLLSLLVVLIPAYLIRPFAPQTQAHLDLSYVLRNASPIATIVTLLLGLLFVFLLWRSTRSGWGKSFLAIGVILLGAAAVLSRQNHFEWMFHPLPQPGYVEAAKASHVKDGDMVLTVEAGGEARAYPVPLMAYHHLVNTTVGGEHIVATY
jgi:hypothetical protein